MRVLVISNFGGDGELDLILRAQAHGHQVKHYFSMTDRTKWFGKGLVDVVDNWRPWMRWADLVILADNTKHLREVDAWRKREGVKVVGATADAAAWELNRTLGQQVMKKAGIDVLPFKEFRHYDDAINHVRRQMKRFVSKPLGDEPDKALSYVSKSPEDMTYMLQRWKKAQKLKGSFMLQDFVPGTEMAVGGWFGPGGFSEGWTENFEHKSLMAGDVGPNTGEMGTAIMMVKKSKLADMVLRPMEDQLDALGYVGYVDVNCIVDEEGTPWPLEFTMRFGWPTMNIQLALSKEPDPIAWLAALADGKDARNWRLNEVAVGAVIAVGDFPHSHITRKEVVNVPIYGVTPRNEDSIHYCEVMQGEAPAETDGTIKARQMKVTAGDYVMVCTGTARTVSDAAKAAYRVVDKINIPGNMMYRNDIGRKLARCLPKVQSHGFAAGWKY